MDAPAIEMVLKAYISQKYAGVSAVLINKWNKPVYIDKRFIPQDQYLMSDWGRLSCAGVKVKYYGLRYNLGDSTLVRLKPGETLATNKINLSDDYFFPAQGYCQFHVSFWVSATPVASDDLTGIFFIDSNTIRFHAESMGFDKHFLKRHPELN
ncbi:hypothetical protein [Citrobacter portucalensis]|uniref:hypothetical protein n=1 Tax=Citrobacter portucalensis TaxID=1639133 RepID=UPI00288B44FD|nr:hypothetical protein [Citrobacter portucalensis]WNI84000.1 hypothetical protein RIK60_00410 [Citrobacter portucalensis]